MDIEGEKDDGFKDLHSKLITDIEEQKPGDISCMQPLEVIMDDEVEHTNKVEEPKAGIVFDTYEELVHYYESYAKQEGFAVFKRSISKDDNGGKRYGTLSCSREGKRPSKSKNEFLMKPVGGTNCKARLNLIIDPQEKCVISSLFLEHNHSLSLNKSRFFRSNRVINSHIKKKLEMNDIAGIRPNKSYCSIVVEAGGPENVPFLDKDCKNFLDKVRRLRLGEGDANAINNYFLKMQADNSKFFYVMDLDEKGRLKNIFWADARSRAAYDEFGDVITFDTTYLTNKYDMPFAPFVGVNHHGQSILLGCGLISKEDTNTFTWLFNSWLTCMYGRAPSAIITDQDKAMQNAIQKVFPHARHRWCLWHIMKKLPEKLKAHKEYDSIKFDLNNAVYNSLSRREFEERWNMMIEKYKLQSNDWLLGLYDERGRWVPIYVKDCFWAGMSTTQRSESMNAFFDGYVNSKTTLKQFVEQYENALASKVAKENQEDFSSYNSMYPCITDFEMEKELQSVYTNSKFKEFQQEIKGKLYCEVSPTKSDGSKYKVAENCKFGEKRRHVTFEVEFDEKNVELICNCKLFEFWGILCRHAISVLIHKNIYHLPAKYILRRWRKEVKRCHTRVSISNNAMSFKLEAQRFQQMCNAFEEVVDFVAENESKCTKVMGWINDLKKSLHAENNCTNCTGLGSAPSVTENETPATEMTGDVVEKPKISSPLVVRGKGRPPTKRKESAVEKVVKKKRKHKKNAMDEEKVEDVEVSQVSECISLKEANDEVLNMSMYHQGIGQQALQMSKKSHITQNNYFPPSTFNVQGNLNSLWQGPPMNNQTCISNYSYRPPIDPSHFCTQSVSSYASTLQIPPFDYQEFYPQVRNNDRDNAHSNLSEG